ncbi:MAG: hypothetical protein KGJ62_01510 [Armatimonadetes bacterium]|nr:hypothetical protein [Armatimonadota bacterium]MDE2205819.1 hypothetical protein [Armatimonadota bacterium]
MKHGYLMNLYVTPRSYADCEARAAAHQPAIHRPEDEFEKALVELYTGWLRYADARQQRYGSGVRDDGLLGSERAEISVALNEFLGEQWAAIGVALRGLLHGERGRLDGRTLDSLAANALRSEGFEPDNL